MTLNRRVMKLLIVPVVLLLALSYRDSSSRALGTVTVNKVALNHSSVKIYFTPVPGAKDYRVYDVAAPNVVKYGGWVHLTPSATCPGTACFNHFVLQSDGVTPVFPYQVTGSYPNGGTGGPQVLDVPSPQIEWNNIGDGNPHTLIIEAVDRLGPAPLANMYSGLQNVALAPGGMLGSNKGPTPDGKNSTNGQGPYTNNPQVIAQSQPFVVQANPNFKAIPSKATATQTFFDTFENSENSTIVQTYRRDSSADAFGNLGQMGFTMNAGTSKAWEIEYRQANNRDSMPFVSGDHFMDMMFDGATPNTSAPTHTIYGSMGMSPVQTVDMLGGKILHMTMEVDGHQSFRRWMAMNISPATDPLQSWDPNGFQINNADQGIFLEIKDGMCTLDIFTGPISGSNPAPTGTAGGPQHGARLWGTAGATGGGAVMCGWDQFFVPANLTKNALGLDDRSRYDFFISQTHAALFQDGQLIVQSDIPAGTFPWSNVPLKVYYSHYLYHSDTDIFDLVTYNVNGQNMCYPLNSYWFNNPVTGTAPGETVCNTAYPAGYGFPYSDERHWDNMGFETLPPSEVSGNNFAALASVVQPPPRQDLGNPNAPIAPRNFRIAGLFDMLFPGGARQPAAMRERYAMNAKPATVDNQPPAHHHH